MTQTKHISNLVGIVVVVFFAASVAFFGATSAHAQNYAAPAGYQSIGNGFYYNSAVGNYFNSVTGQYSVTQPTLSIPQNFSYYGYGVYYNSATGQYFNPATGQYSTIVPLGPNNYANGSYTNIPGGYSSATFGTYYNSSTGLYYDPSTGFYSTMAPTGQAYGMPQTTLPTTAVPTVPIYTSPGLPNTGAGGNAPATLAILLLAGAVSVGGLVYLSRKYLATE